MEQQLNRIETTLYRIQDQLTNIAGLLNNNDRSLDQQLLDYFAEKRRAALERYRLEYEQSGRPQHPTPALRKWSDLGEDEID